MLKIHTNGKNRTSHSRVWGWQLVTMDTCVVFEPDRVEVERGGQVKDVRIVTLQQMRDDQLRPNKDINMHLLTQNMCGCVYYCRTSNRFPLGWLPASGQLSSSVSLKFPSNWWHWRCSPARRFLSIIPLRMSGPTKRNERIQNRRTSKFADSFLNSFSNLLLITNVDHTRQRFPACCLH